MKRILLLFASVATLTCALAAPTLARADGPEPWPRASVPLIFPLG